MADLNGNKPYVGRRTGLDPLGGKQVRRLQNGFDNFDDYWTESEAEESVTAWLNEKENLTATKPNRKPLQSMSPFTPNEGNETNKLLLKPDSLTVSTVSKPTVSQSAPKDVPVSTDDDEDERDTTITRDQEISDRSLESEEEDRVEKRKDDSATSSQAQMTGTGTSSDGKTSRVVAPVAHDSSEEIDERSSSVKNNSASETPTVEGTLESNQNLNHIGNVIGSISQLQRNVTVTFPPPEPSSAIQNFKTRKRLTYSTTSTENSANSEPSPVHTSSFYRSPVAKRLSTDTFKVPVVPSSSKTQDMSKESSKDVTNTSTDSHDKDIDPKTVASEATKDQTRLVSKQGNGTKSTKHSNTGKDVSQKSRKSAPQDMKKYLESPDLQTEVEPEAVPTKVKSVKKATVPSSPQDLNKYLQSPELAETTSSEPDVEPKEKSLDNSRLVVMVQRIDDKHFTSGDLSFQSQSQESRSVPSTPVTELESDDENTPLLALQRNMKRNDTSVPEKQPSLNKRQSVADVEVLQPKKTRGRKPKQVPQNDVKESEPAAKKKGRRSRVGNTNESTSKDQEDKHSEDALEPKRTNRGRRSRNPPPESDKDVDDNNEPESDNSVKTSEPEQMQLKPKRTRGAKRKSLVVKTKAMKSTSSTQDDPGIKTNDEPEPSAREDQGQDQQALSDAEEIEMVEVAESYVIFNKPMPANSFYSKKDTNNQSTSKSSQKNDKKTAFTRKRSLTGLSLDCLPPQMNFNFDDDEDDKVKEEKLDVRSNSNQRRRKPSQSDKTQNNAKSDGQQAESKENDQREKRKSKIGYSESKSESEEQTTKRKRKSTAKVLETKEELAQVGKGKSVSGHTGKETVPKDEVPRPKRKSTIKNTRKEDKDEEIQHSEDDFEDDQPLSIIVEKKKRGRRGRPSQAQADNKSPSLEKETVHNTKGRRGRNKKNVVQDSDENKPNRRKENDSSGEDNLENLAKKTRNRKASEEKEKASDKKNTSKDGNTEKDGKKSSKRKPSEEKIDHDSRQKNTLALAEIVQKDSPKKKKKIAVPEVPKIDDSDSEPDDDGDLDESIIIGLPPEVESSLLSHVPRSDLPEPVDSEEVDNQEDEDGPPIEASPQPPSPSPQQPKRRVRPQKGKKKSSAPSHHTVSKKSGVHSISRKPAKQLVLTPPAEPSSPSDEEEHAMVAERTSPIPVVPLPETSERTSPIPDVPLPQTSPTDVDHMSPEVSAIQGQRKRHLAGEDSMMFAEPTPPSPPKRPRENKPTSLETPPLSEIKKPANVHLMKRVEMETPEVVHMNNVGTPRSILKKRSAFGQELDGDATINSPRHIYEVTGSSTPQSERPRVSTPKKVQIFAPQTEPSDGLRRSQRTRVTCLDWYRNERIRYDRRKSGYTIAGILSGTEGDQIQSKVPLTRTERIMRLSKNKRTRLPASPHNLSAHEPLPAGVREQPGSEVKVVNPHTREEVVVDCVMTHDQFRFFGASGAPAKAEDPLVLCKVLKQKAFSVGQVVLRPAEEKGTQLVRNDSMVFIVKQGKIAVTIHQTTSILETDAMFFVPQGNTYSIKNLRQDEAKLWFFQHKG